MEACATLARLFRQVPDMATYAQIQSERVCGESDISVEFVNDILNS